MSSDNGRLEIHIFVMVIPKTNLTLLFELIVCKDLTRFWQNKLSETNNV